MVPHTTCMGGRRGARGSRGWSVLTQKVWQAHIYHWQAALEGRQGSSLVRGTSRHHPSPAQPTSWGVRQPLRAETRLGLAVTAARKGAVWLAV